jgi:hypothetical protein
VEPKAGRHFAYVSARKTGKDFSKILFRISRNYPEAKKTHIVMDNYRTHSLKSMILRYSDEKGAQIWNRFVVHYTSKHARWLNQAEIEIGILSKQCLGQERFETIEKLRNSVNAWKSRMNKKRLKSTGRLRWKGQKRNSA